MDTQSVSVTIWLPIDIVDQIDNLRDKSQFYTTRSAVIRGLVEDKLKTLPRKIARPRT